MKHCRVTVYGHVQGVGFRYFVKLMAERHRICGWVRNLYDGTVEIDCEGEQRDVEAFVQLIKTGNRYSDVEHVEMTTNETLEGYRSFDIVE